MFCVCVFAAGLFCTACCYLRKSCAHGVLGAVEKRPAIILHACYAIGKRDYLVYTVKCILPTQRSHRHMYCIVCQYRTEWGFSTVQCLLYLR